jgi:hypothetical protein
VYVYVYVCWGALDVGDSARVCPPENGTLWACLHPCGGTRADRSKPRSVGQWVRRSGL